MAKILITFLGVHNATRTYRTANYSLVPYPNEEYSFIADYLLTHEKYDKLIIVGTARSMWEEVYNRFSTQKGTYDEEVYSKIYEYASQANHKSEIDESYAPLIEQALPPGSKVVFIKYGLNEEELNYNIQTLLATEQYFSNKDRITMDITHSFRSLPLLGLMLIQYLKEVSMKEIKLDAIYYGMLDISGEMNGITPIVDINKISTVLHWIKVVNSIKERYDFNSLALTIKQMGNEYTPLYNAIKNLNDCIQTNSLGSLETQLNVANATILKYNKALKNNAELSFMLQYVKDFAQEIKDEKDPWIEKCLIAKKHYANGMTGLSVLAIWEAIMDKTASIRERTRNDADHFKGHYLPLTKHLKKLKTIALSEEQMRIVEWVSILNKMRNDISHGNSVSPNHLKKYANILEEISKILKTNKLRFLNP